RRGGSDRTERRDRVALRARLPRSRAGAAGARPRAARSDPGRPPSRRAAGADRHPHLHRRRRAPARRRDRPRSRTDRRAHRPPLRAAAAQTTRPDRGGAGIARGLQPARGPRRARRRPAQRAGDVRVTDLYQQTIVDHARRPRNFGPLEGANRTAEGSNPLCGDELRLHLKLGDTIEAARFEGAGCAICLASASMMTLAVTNRTPAEAARLMQRVRELVAGGDGANLGDLASLKGVAQYPARQKCALLAWRALEAAVGGETGLVSTEL